MCHFVVLEMTKQSVRECVNDVSTGLFISRQVTGERFVRGGYFYRATGTASQVVRIRAI